MQTGLLFGPVAAATPAARVAVRPGVTATLPCDL